MRQLDRVVIRELFRSRGRTVVLVLALALAFLMPAGIEMGLRSLVQTRDTFTSRLGLADLEVRLLPEDVRNLPEWSQVPGLARVEQRLLMPGTIEHGGKSHNALMVFLSEAQPRLNSLELLSGRSLRAGTADEGVLERSAREYLGLDAGARLAVKVGQQTFEQDIVGVARSSEFLMVAANPEFFLPEKGSLAVVYTNLERIYENLGFRMVNDLLFRFEPGADPERTKRAVLQSLATKRIERIIARDEHLSYKHIAIDFDVFRIFQPAISLVLALLAAGLVVISFDRMVRSQQSELGALMALGYSGVELTRSYVIAALGLGAAGSVVGVAGALGFRSAFLRIYGQAHGLAYLEQHTYPSVLFQSAIVVVLLAVCSAWLATRLLRRLGPLALMKPLLYGAVAKSGSVRLPSWMSGLPFAVRVGLGNVRRTPRLALTTILSVGLSVAVGVSYLICLDSMHAAIGRSFQSQPWDRAVSFLYPTLEDEYAEVVREVPGARAEGFVRSQASLEHAGKALDVALLGLAHGDSLRRVNLVAGRMPTGPGEVVLGADLVRKLAADVGAVLRLDLRGAKHPVKVVGIKSDVVLSEAVLDLRALQTLLELEDQVTGMFVAVPAAHLGRLDKALDGQAFVGRITNKDALASEFKKILQDLRKLVLLVAGIALAVAVVFIVANLNMTMNERVVEFSTLWALGCGRRTAKGIVLADGLAHACVALLVALPATLLLAKLLNGLASKAWFDQPTALSLPLLFGAGAATLALTAIGAQASFRSFWSDTLVRRLRDRAIQ